MTRLRLLLPLLLFLLPLSVALAQTPATSPAKPSLETFINKTVYPATVLLFSQDDSGTMHMRCTATAIDHSGDTYTFVTAAHCGSTDDEDHKRAKVDKNFFYVSPDNPGEKKFLRAEVVAAGYQHKGDDFLLLSVRTDYQFPTVAIGTDAEQLNDPVINVASPQGLGRQVFEGKISLPKVDRAILYEDINWTGAMLLVLPATNGGSSGSAIICATQQAICGFLVGTVGGTSTIGLPVSRFREFRKEVLAGTYKYYKKGDED